MLPIAMAGLSFNKNELDRFTFCAVGIDSWPVLESLPCRAKPTRGTDAAHHEDRGRHLLASRSNPQPSRFLAHLGRHCSGRRLTEQEGIEPCKSGRTNELKGCRAYLFNRPHQSLFGLVRSFKAHGSRGACLEVFWALVSEAQEFYADAAIDLSFEVDGQSAP